MVQGPATGLLKGSLVYSVTKDCKCSNICGGASSGEIIDTI